MGGFQQILEKYHLEKWFQKENLVVLVLVGILLIIIALPTKKAEDIGIYESEYERRMETAAEDSIKESEDFAKDSAEELPEDYASILEEKLTLILSRIRGIGNVYVMITLDESREQIVEKDLSETAEQTIYETEGSGSKPYVRKTIYPKVEGVAVVAEGAGTGRITQNITEIVQALFDIEVHKIKVVAG